MGFVIDLRGPGGNVGIVHFTYLTGVGRMCIRLPTNCGIGAVSCGARVLAGRLGVDLKTYSFLGCGREYSGGYVSTSTSTYVRNSRTTVFWHVPRSRLKGRLLWIMLTLVRIDDNFR